MTEPTPRPWTVLENTGSFNGAIVSPQGEAELGTWMIAERIRWPVDAAFIVRACNAHDDLVAALQLALGYVEKTHSSLSGAVGPDNIKPDLDQIRAALARATAT